MQQELVRDVGLRSVRQSCGEKFSDVEEFLRSEEYPVVLKPTDSAGSDGVKLCQSFEEAKEHFEYLLTVEAVNGGYNTKVLCQEFLKGKEVSSIWSRLSSIHLLRQQFDETILTLSNIALSAVMVLTVCY